MSDKCWRFLADIAKGKVFRDMMHVLEVLDFEREWREPEKCKGCKYVGMSRPDYCRVWDNLNETGYLENIDTQLKQQGKILLSLTETQNDEEMIVKAHGESDSESVDKVSSNL
jgi:hypothetical protein